MDKDILLKDVLLNVTPVKDCDMVLECNHGLYRLYIYKETDPTCFYAVALEWNGCESDGDIWACEQTTVTPLFNCVAYFDGVRHLEFNRESENLAGYIYYPNIEGICELFAKLREVEKEYCPNCD